MVLMISTASFWGGFTFTGRPWERAGRSTGSSSKGASPWSLQMGRGGVWLVPETADTVVAPAAAAAIIA